jgi:WD40 repeat protein
MKLTPETLAGTLVIALLVAAGAWYAQDPASERWPLTGFSAGDAKGNGRLPVNINHLDWSADGRKLLARIRGENDSEARLALIDVALPDRQSELEAVDDTVSAAVLAPEAQHVLAASVAGRLWRLCPESSDLPTPLIESPVPTSFTAMAITTDGGMVAAGTSQGTVYLCDAVRRSPIVLSGTDPESMTDLHFDRDGMRLLGAKRNGRICLWDVASGDVLQEFTGHKGQAMAAVFLSDGKRIISAGLDDTVRIWEIDSGLEIWRGEFELKGVSTLAVSADGRTAAWAGFSPRIIMWDLHRHAKKFEIPTSAKCVLHLKFSPDGTLLAAAGQDDSIRLYDVWTGAETRRIEIASRKNL